MKQVLRAKKWTRKAQTAMEYALILGVISVALAAVWTTFGENVKTSIQDTLLPRVKEYIDPTE